MSAITVDLTARTVSGTAKGDGVNWRRYGLVWSRRQGCWVWARTIRPETVAQRARQIAADHGAEVIGTAEAVDIDPDERDAAILARHERRAENAETEADARYAAVRSTMNVIPMGQPILVGHHSEGRHRRDLARMDTNMRRSIEADQRAKDEQRLADGAARRIAHRATLAAAVPVPVEMIQPGDEVLRMTAARRRTYTVHKVNRTTIAWAWQGCSGSFKHAEAVELHRDGVQLWPAPTAVESVTA